MNYRLVSNHIDTEKTKISLKSPADKADFPDNLTVRFVRKGSRQVLSLKS